MNVQYLVLQCTTYFVKSFYVSESPRLARLCLKIDFEQVCLVLHIVWCGVFAQLFHYSETMTFTQLPGLPYA